MLSTDEIVYVYASFKKLCIQNANKVELAIAILKAHIGCISLDL